MCDTCDSFRKNLRGIRVTWLIIMILWTLVVNFTHFERIGNFTHFERIGNFTYFEKANNDVTYFERIMSHVSAHRGDQTRNIWISRLSSFPGFSFEWRGLRLLTWETAWNFGDSRENVFDMCGDSCEDLLEISLILNEWCHTYVRTCDTRMYIYIFIRVKSHTGWYQGEGSGGMSHMIMHTYMHIVRHVSAGMSKRWRHVSAGMLERCRHVTHMNIHAYSGCMCVEAC